MVFIDHKDDEKVPEVIDKLQVADRAATTVFPSTQ